MIREIKDDFSRWRVRKAVMHAMDRNREEWGYHTTKSAIWEVVETGGYLVECGNGDAWLIAQQQGLDLVIVWSGGKHIIAYVPQLVAWAEAKARDCGAARVVMSGRKAWSRVLRPHGYYVDRVIMAKELDDKELDDVLQDA